MILKTPICSLIRFWNKCYIDFSSNPLMFKKKNDEQTITNFLVDFHPVLLHEKRRNSV